MDFLERRTLDEIGDGRKRMGCEKVLWQKQTEICGARSSWREEAWRKIGHALNFCNGQFKLSTVSLRGWLDNGKSLANRSGVCICRNVNAKDGQKEHYTFCQQSRGWLIDWLKPLMSGSIDWLIDWLLRLSGSAELDIIISVCSRVFARRFFSDVTNFDTKRQHC